MSMKMENFFNNTSHNLEKVTTPSLPKREVSKRLWLANEISMKTMVGKIEIQGKENIEKLPPDAKIVIATMHDTDLAVPITIHTIANDLNVAVVDMSVHHKAFGGEGEFGSYVAGKIAGMDNFIPIGFKKDENGEKSAKAFNPDDFIPVVKAVEEGKAVIIAAHNPIKDSTKSFDEIKGGYGCVYSALLADADIVPITVELDQSVGKHGDEVKALFKEKPNAKVVIGESFKLEKIEGLEKLAILAHKSGKDMSREELDDFLRIVKALKERSQFVMEKMSSQLHK